MPKPKFLIGVSADDEEAEAAPDSEAAEGEEEKDPVDELARLLKAPSSKFRALLMAAVHQCMDE